MEQGEFVPQGSPESSPTVIDGMPGFGNSLILPAIFGTATWAVDRFTATSLGDWRYLPVAALGLCTLYFVVLAFVLGLFTIASTAGRFNVPSVPRWLRLSTIALFAVAFVTGLVLKAIHDTQHPITLDTLISVLLLTSGSLGIASSSHPKLLAARAKRLTHISLLLAITAAVLTIVRWGR